MDEILNQDVQETQPIETPEPPKRDELQELKDLNFRQMRQEAERERLRAQQLEQEISELRRSAKPVEPDEWDTDEIAEKRHVKKLTDQLRAANEKLSRKADEMEQQMQKIAAQSVLNEVLGKFPDFYSVVNEDTLAQLKAKEPELFESAMSRKGEKAGMVSAYKSIKTYVNTKSYESHDARIAENKTKPKSTATIPSMEPITPLSEFSEDKRWKLSADEAKRLRADTARCARNR